MTRRTVSIERRLALAAIGAAALGLTGLIGAPAQAADFSGKRIEWIIPFKEGGGSDTWARFYAPQLAGNLPGEPVIAVSDYLAERLAADHGLGADRVVVIPGGVDMDAFAEEAVGAERTVRLADAWGLTEDPRPVVMLPGRIAPTNGYETMARAAALLRAGRGDDFLCLVVGEGEEKYVSALEADIVAAGAAGRAKSGGRSAGVSSRRSLSMYRFSTTPCSSRTLPGQPCAARRAIRLSDTRFAPSP